MNRFSFIVVVFLSCVASSYANNVVDLQAICGKADNPSFCLNLLQSKPGGPGSDLVALTGYTIGVLRTDVSNAINLLTNLIAQSGGDHDKTYHYKNCLSEFESEEGALGEVDEALQLLKTGDYDGVNLRVTAVMTDVYNCVVGDPPTNPPFKDTSEFPKQASVVRQVSQIILIMSNILLQ